MLLQLADGRKIKVAVTFECPDDDVIAMTESPETEDMGLSVTPVSQISIIDKSMTIESSIFATREELGRVIFELMAVYKTMNQMAALADVEWAGYRNKVRLRAVRAQEAVK